MDSGTAQQISVEAEIERYRFTTIEHRRAITDGGIWIFLAALGCWGVTSPGFQLLAYAVTLVMFIERSKNSIGMGKTFSAIARDLNQRINTEIKLPSNRERLKARLNEVGNQYLSAGAILKGGLIFLLGWLFFGFSMLFTIWNFK